MALLLLSLEQMPVSSFAVSSSRLRKILTSTRVCTASRKMMSNSPSAEDAQNDTRGLGDIGNDNKQESSIKVSGKSWKERIDISIAKSRKIRGSNYVQISTIDYETMEPRCRTVVFRGFMKDVPFGAVEEVLLGEQEEEESQQQPSSSSGKYTDCIMKMITDLRSNKVSEVESLKNKEKNGNTVEMVWWFPKSSEQYRVRGRLQFIGNGGPLNTENAKESNHKDYFIGERKQQWGNLSDMAREQFYWDEPGLPYCTTKGHDQGVPPGGRDEEGRVFPVPDSFVLMLLYPTKIDYLKLGENYKQVDEWKWNGDESQWEQLRMNP